MKKLAILAACLMTSLAAFAADGTVNFANKVGTTVDAPITDYTGAKLLGANYVAQLWAGPVGGTLAAQGDPIPFRTQAAAAGYWAGAARTITGVTAGQPALIEIRAWRVAAGATWDAAFGNQEINDLSTTVGNWGKSATPLQVTTGGAGEPPSLPADLVGLTGFKLNVVPEPSIIALGLVGAGALLLRRRK